MSQTRERSFVSETGQTITYEPLAGTAEARERVGAELKRFGLEHGDERLEVVSPFEPAGDQPNAIKKLSDEEKMLHEEISTVIR